VGEEHLRVSLPRKLGGKRVGGTPRGQFGKSWVRIKVNATIIGGGNEVPPMTPGGASQNRPADVLLNEESH